jgi:3-ketosteroid 9alpha-monooxygenase subunit A
VNMVYYIRRATAREGRFPLGQRRSFAAFPRRGHDLRGIGGRPGAIIAGHDRFPGEVRAVRYFARDLVLFRTESGVARVLDAFCPHLGAHLGGGRVSAEHIVCPFHAWEWDGGGRCAAVPYAKRIPPGARIGAWPVVEHSGVVFAWHDATGRPPRFEVPPHPELADPDWVPVERHEFHIDTCVQEILENAHDPAHFRAVHGVEAVPASASSYDGPRHVAENRGELKTPRGKVETIISGASHGMGVGHLRTRGLADMAQLLLQTPIDAEHVHARWQFAVPKREDGTPSPVGVAFAREFVRQFRQGIPIWERKAYLPHPTLCDGDGDIARFRRWTTRFYPAADGDARGAS